MENVLFANVKKLYDNELYSSVIPTASLLSTFLRNDHSATTPEMEYQLLLFQANSYYHERKFRLAQKQFDTALQMRKAMSRYKNSQLSSIESAYTHFADIETRYRLSMCHKELGEASMAISTLQKIPAKSRTPKVNMFLARLLHHSQSANSTDASLAYTDVVRECPMALDAITSMLEIGSEAVDVIHLVMNASAVPKNMEWLSTWIKAHAQLYNRNHLEAAKIFQTLNDTTKFHQNVYLLTMIGKSLYYYGNFSQAQQYLETAHLVNPHNWEHLMPLAVVYDCNSKNQDLEKLTAQMTNIHEFGSDHWLVLAQSIFSAGKMEKASYFTHRAISLDPRNVEAHLLRGKISLQLKKHKDAIYFFRTAQNISNYRFEVYKGLLGSYIGLKKLKEAQTLCANAVRSFRNSPRSYIMFARILLHSTHPIAKKTSRKYAVKALEIDANFTPSVALMAEIHQANGETKEAADLLKKHLENWPHHKLFTMLGDILSSMKDIDGALENYTAALSIEPSFHRAVEGINALGQASRAAAKQEDSSMGQSTSHDEEWPIECDEPSIDVVELSSPAIANDDAESDTFSDPFWQDVDTELTN